MHAFYSNFLDLMADDAGTTIDGDGAGAVRTFGHNFALENAIGIPRMFA
jgi:hypothetical protein